MRVCAIVVFVALSASRQVWADGPVLPLGADDQQEISKNLGAGVVGTALPSDAITDPLRYFSLQERAPVYQVTSGPNTGKNQTLHVMKGKRPAGNVAWRTELSPSLFGFINAAGTGDLLMPAVTDTDEGVIVITTPANPFLLKGMNPGESRSLSQRVSVNYLDDPTDQRYSGSLSGTYTYLGTYQVTVPAGTYQAIAVRLKFSGKVGPAHTEDTAYYFLAPGAGIVAMVSQEDVEAFWIVHIDTTSGKVLVSS